MIEGVKTHRPIMDKDGLYEYGQKRKEFLMKECRGWWNHKCATEPEWLLQHLHDIDMRAVDMETETRLAIMKREGITEEMKNTDLFGWVRAANMAQFEAEKIVEEELIYQKP